MGLLRTLLLFASLAAAAGAGPALAGDRPRKPNIVVIVADDLGYADLGYHGCKDIRTPNIDALARRGVRFTSGYVSGPYCSPTRSGLLTGRYQNRYGHEFNPGGGGKQGLPTGLVTLADRLKMLGYVSALVGKWHLGAAPGMTPLERGFDEFYGFLGGAHSYFPDKGAGILRGGKKIEEKEYLTDAMAREATDFIDRNARKPFFLYLCFNAVHTPMHAKEADLKRFAAIEDKMRQTYAAMLSSMDDAIGKVLLRLAEKRLDEDTLIFFISDNGGPTMKGTTINGSRNTPLRGSKRTLWEGGVRVPFIIAWQGTLPTDKSYDHPVISLDIHPTALASAGAEIKAEWKLDGVNLLPYLTGKKSEAPHEYLFWRFGKMQAARQGDWKMVMVDSGPHLFNLKDDIGETKDLARDHPEVMRAMRNAWDRWNMDNIAPLWGQAEGKKKKAKD